MREERRGKRKVKGGDESKSLTYVKKLLPYKIKEGATAYDKIKRSPRLQGDAPGGKQSCTLGRGEKCEKKYQGSKGTVEGGRTYLKSRSSTIKGDRRDKKRWEGIKKLRE